MHYFYYIRRGYPPLGVVGLIWTEYSISIMLNKRFSDDINVIICKTIGKADIVKLPISEYKKLITE